MKGQSQRAKKGAPHEYRGLQRWELSFRTQEAAPREMTEGKRRPQDPGDDRAEVTLLFSPRGAGLSKAAPVIKVPLPFKVREGREMCWKPLCAVELRSPRTVSSVPPFSPPHPIPLNTALCGEGWPGVEFPHPY